MPAQQCTAQTSLAQHGACQGSGSELTWQLAHVGPLVRAACVGPAPRVAADLRGVGHHAVLWRVDVVRLGRVARLRGRVGRRISAPAASAAWSNNVSRRRAWQAAAASPHPVDSPVLVRVIVRDIGRDGHGVGPHPVGPAVARVKADPVVLVVLGDDHAQDVDKVVLHLCGAEGGEQEMEKRPAPCTYQCLVDEPAMCWRPCSPPRAHCTAAASLPHLLLLLQRLVADQVAALQRAVSLRIAEAIWAVVEQVGVLEGVGRVVSKLAGCRQEGQSR